MVKTTLEDIDLELKNNNFLKSILMAHDFVQLALYDLIMAALKYLNLTKDIELYLRKSLKTPDCKNSTLKNHEIKLAYDLGLVSDLEKVQISNIKKFRDSKAAHLSLYFDKQVISGEESQSKVEEVIKAAKQLSIIMIKKRDTIVREDMKDIKRVFNNENLNDILREHTHKKLLNILRSE